MAKRRTGTSAPREIGPPPATGDQLHAWLRAHLRLNVPRGPLDDSHQAPFDYLLHSFFEPPLTTGESHAAAFPRDLVLWANRGGGKTFLGAVATLLDLVFKPGIEIQILGGSADQSRRMFQHLRRLFDSRERPHLAALIQGAITADGLRLTSGSEARILAQSHTSVRGTRVQILRCDEVDNFKRDIWEAAQFVTRSKQCGPFFVRGRVECLSTMHRPFGVMHDLVEQCKQGSRRLFKWNVLEVMERCGPERRCTAADPGTLVSLPQIPDQAQPTPREGDCVLLPECRGRAKERDGGHYFIADAIAAKRRTGASGWESEMLCVRPRRDGVVFPEFDPRAHVGRWELQGDILVA